MSDVKEKILQDKIIGIIRNVRKDNILKTVRAFLEGGIELLEITFDQKDERNIHEALNCIDLVNKEFGDNICLGAGTVITVEQVNMAVKTGAKYIVSPNMDAKVIAKTKELGKVSIPGAYTPTEIVEAHKNGADFIKLFPAGILGPNYLKAILSPLDNISILAVGGINLNNVNLFIENGAKGVGVGGSLVDKDAIHAGEFQRLKENAQKFMRILRG